MRYGRRSYTNGRPRPWWERLSQPRRRYFRRRTSDESDDESDVVVVTSNRDPSKPVAIDVDLQKIRNRASHNCREYGGSDLVLRRGDEFQMKVTINTTFDRDSDVIELQFYTGENPKVSKNTKININVAKQKAAVDADDKEDWYAYLSDVDQSSSKSVMTVEVMIPATALVAKYQLVTKVYDTDPKKRTKRYVKEQGEDIYILFNAWCKDDQVYMSNSRERREYVEAETGRIWRGSYKSSRGKAWAFDQYSRYCLWTAMYLLEKSYLKESPHLYGDAVQVCRALSAMANSSDDNGVLIGNWSGDYGGGTKPTAWNGSRAILLQYWSKKRPVKYGQCWVFSGLLTTLCRTLGIPARSVTNFCSAHDTDGSCTIDKHRTPDGEIFKNNYGLNDDSVWNFHVWNEVWMERQDLPTGYDGWQAVDSTPQESSAGVYRCGPSPVRAIKEANLHLGYDSKFIFAEVNSIRLNWTVTRDSYFSDPRVDKSAAHVGQKISTKAVGSHLRNDITDEYKDKYGSTAQKEAVEKAMQYSSRKTVITDLYEDVEGDVAFTSDVSVEPNGDVTVTFISQNKSSSNRTIVTRLTAVGERYNDVYGARVMSKRDHFSLKPSEKQTRTETLKALDYLNEIDEDETLKVFVWGSVRETGQVYENSEPAEIEKPDMELVVSNNNPKVGEKIQLNIKVTNPTAVELTRCDMHVEAPGILKDLEIPINGTIKAYGSYEHTMTLTPKYPGSKDIIANFNCRQLSGISGSVEINVV